jgi:hypothetical protein
MHSRRSRVSRASRSLRSDSPECPLKEDVPESDVGKATASCLSSEIGHQLENLQLVCYDQST